MGCDGRSKMALLLFKLKCGISWECLLEYVHMTSLRSGFQEVRSNLPRLLKASPGISIALPPPFSCLVKQVINAIRLHLSMGCKAKNLHPSFIYWDAWSPVLKARDLAVCTSPSLALISYHTAWGSVFMLVELQSHPKHTSKEMEKGTNSCRIPTPAFHGQP